LRKEKGAYFAFFDEGVATERYEVLVMGEVKCTTQDVNDCTFSSLTLGLLAAQSLLACSFILFVLAVPPSNPGTRQRYDSHRIKSVA